jgi:hypothetical protein
MLTVILSFKPKSMNKTEQLKMLSTPAVLHKNKQIAEF